MLRRGSQRVKELIIIQEEGKKEIEYIVNCLTVIQVIQTFIED